MIGARLLEAEDRITYGHLPFTLPQIFVGVVMDSGFLNGIANEVLLLGHDCGAYCCRDCSISDGDG